MWHLLEDIDQVMDMIKDFVVSWFDLKLAHHV